MAEAHPSTGMTINERLYVAGLADPFDAAVRARDRALMISILKDVEVRDAASCVDAILKDPFRYGY
jgi:hypothetical protein